jgi:hypothetical protein
MLIRLFASVNEAHDVVRVDPGAHVRSHFPARRPAPNPATLTPGAAFALLSMLDAEAQRRQRRRRSAASIGLWRDLLVPMERLEVPRPRGLHHATYQRLVNEYNRVLAELNALPNRALWPRSTDGLRAPVPQPHRAYSTSARTADTGTADQALVPGKRCRALPGRLHKICPALDSDRLPALRARWLSGSPLLRPRGTAPRAAPAEDMKPYLTYLPNRCVWNQVGSILGKCLDYLP